MIDLQVPVLTVAAKGIGGRAMQQVFPPCRIPTRRAACAR